MEYAVSLHQPWASLIAHGIKRIETRTWFPPNDMIGNLIAIHAAARPNGRVQLWSSPTFRRHANLLDVELGGANMPHGAVVAVARIEAYGIVTDHRSYVDHEGKPRLLPAGEIPYGDYAVARRIWVFSDVARLTEPVPASGHQRLWKLTHDELAAIWNQQHIHVSGASVHD